MKTKEASKKPAPQMDNNLFCKDTHFFQQIKEVMRELPAICPRSGEINLFSLIKKGGRNAEK